MTSPGRVRDARLAARCVPDGLGRPAAHRSVRRRHRGHPPLRSRNAALARFAASVRLLPAREVPLDAEGVQGLSPPLPHALRRRPDAVEHLSRRERGPRARRASSSTCRCSSTTTATLFDYLPPDAVIVQRCRACTARSSKDWQRHRSALRRSPPRHRAAGARAGRAVPAPEELRSALARFAARSRSMPSRRTSSSAAQRPRSATSRPPRRASCVSMRAPSSRSRRSTRFCSAVRRARADRRRLGRAPRSAAGNAARGRARSRPPSPAGMRSPHGSAPLALTVAPDLEGLTLTEPADRRHLRSAAVRRARPSGAPAQARAVDPEAILRDLQDLTPGAPGRARGIRRRPLRRPAADGSGRPERRVPGARIPGRRPRLRAGALAAPRHAATPARRPRARRCTSSARDQWAKARKRAAEQIRDVAAELLDLYARRKAQQGLELPVRELEYQTFANAFPFEETEDQAQAIRDVLADLRERAADGSHRVRRCRLRQDRSRHARGVRRRAGRQAGRGARADHAARAAAPGQLPRPLRRLAGAHRSAVALRHRQGNAGDARRPRAAARSTSSSPRIACCTRMRASRTSA